MGKGVGEAQSYNAGYFGDYVTQVWRNGTIIYHSQQRLPAIDSRLKVRKAKGCSVNYGMIDQKAEEKDALFNGSVALT